MELSAKLPSERLVKEGCVMLYGARRAALRRARSGDVECKERALKHKFGVGETVYFTASNVARPAATGTYEVIRLLPTDGDDCQYRIKSSTEAFERVAKESQLDIG